MGGRKSKAKKAIKKKRPTVAKQFKCLFCNHEEAVECKIDRGANVGTLNCKICDAHFQTTVHALTEPIDIFSAWLDDTSDRQQQVSTSLLNRHSSSNDS